MANEKEMASMLDKHDYQIKEQIFPRLVYLEKAQKETTAKIDDMQKGQIQLENTVLKETKTVQELQRSSEQKVDKVFNILVELIQGNQQADTQINVAKLDTKTKIAVAVIGGIFGAGGLLQIFSFFMNH